MWLFGKPARAAFIVKKDGVWVGIYNMDVVHSIIVK